MKSIAQETLELLDWSHDTCFLMRLSTEEKPSKAANAVNLKERNKQMAPKLMTSLRHRK
jgi:hypothetical protein